MPYSFEKLKDEPIIVNMLSADFDFASEGEPSIREAITLLDKQKTPVYYISDVSAVHFGFSESVQASSMAARGDNPLFHHPKVKQVLLVVGDIMQELSAQGMQSDTFGNVNIRTFKSVEDALAYARSQ